MRTSMMSSKKPVLTVAISLLLVTLMMAGFSSQVMAKTFPALIPLPNGFQPEGIAVGPGHAFYVGSIPTGAIYKGDLRTGEGQILVPPQEGRNAIGLAFDPRSNYLFVAGGLTGHGFVYDAQTGQSVHEFSLTDAPFLGTFVNDVVVTREAAYFTDSFRPFLYRVPLGPGGSLPNAAPVEEIALGGDFVFTPGIFVFNTNGIDATPNGKWLVIVNSVQQELYRVDPQTGDAMRIDLGGASVPNGDGLILDGKTLYVVQNALNQIAVIQLNSSLDGGAVIETITDANFRVPTTIAEFGESLYAVNARFGVPPSPDTEYEVVMVSKH